jgi:hypothetical protein
VLSLSSVKPVFKCLCSGAEVWQDFSGGEKKKKVKSRTENTCHIRHFAATAAFRKSLERYFQFGITMYNTQKVETRE